MELKCQSFENHTKFKKGLEDDIKKLLHELAPNFYGATLSVIGLYFAEHIDIPKYFNTKTLGNGEIGICWAIDQNN